MRGASGALATSPPQAEWHTLWNHSRLKNHGSQIKLYELEESINYLRDVLDYQSCCSPARLDAV